jgi:hypothetical protein
MKTVKDYRADADKCRWVAGLFDKPDDPTALALMALAAQIEAEAEAVEGRPKPGERVAQPIGVGVAPSSSR